jgi:molybdopterin-guanine dinucleotide biosynthesis protein A
MKALILAGGQSRRMGRDKATIERPDGTRQLDHLVSIALAVGTEVIVSTNTPEIVPAGIEVLPDRHPGDGPLGALASFHARYPEQTVLLIGCDHFLLEGATLRKLLDEHQPTNPATAFPNRIDQRPEPLCAIYSPEVLAHAQPSLEAGEFCARHFLEAQPPVIIQPADPVALDNANSPADLAEAFAKLTEGVIQKTVNLLYFAKLREARGLDEEQVTTAACTAAGLYEEIRFLHRLPLELDALRCARNGDFCDWSTRIEQGDELVFIPPVAGG